ncbi:hypothetical protein PCC7418_0358 [Halothece sp. PCC 7418]|uniref:hypothetical protein n=1 Tax=Halothece sp. (strain PCC 7418) TaxID=65093 RepID=UPI0002A07AEA|nr:hypothetical protein [Halothece sp. PCC 7418]AFZ42592.1 hypothetical protein PCC7418_0358 [Halothece sp. PCC 7418]
MSHQSFPNQFFARSRQIFKKIWTHHPQESSYETAHPPLQFLERYHCDLFPEQTFSQTTEERRIDPLKLRTAELILKQVNLYYLPHRLESLLPYCDPFTAVATFLNALNFSYETLLQDAEKQKLGQDIIQEFMELEKDYDWTTTAINDFPLYDSASTHDLADFKNTIFAFQRALDVIEILEQVQPRNYQKQKDNLLQFWHQHKIQKLEKIIMQLTQ